MADTSMFGDWDAPAGEAVAPAAVEPAIAADTQQAPVDFMGDLSSPAENGVLEGGQGTDMLQAEVPQEADPFAPPIGDVGAGMDEVAAPVDLPLGDDSAAAPVQDFMGAEFGAADDLGGLGNGMPAEAPVVGLGAEEAQPEIEDARVAWRQQNYEMLKQKDVEEDGLRSEGRQKAQEERELFMKQRTATIDEKRKLNREMQTALETGPRGSGTWERVLSMVDMKFDPGRHRDVERLKMLMFAAREKAPVAASG